MIRLTRLNGGEFILNADLIRLVERCPDTLITLISGDTLMVKEPMDEVVKRTVEYQQSKYIIPRHVSLPIQSPLTDN